MQKTDSPSPTLAPEELHEKLLRESRLKLRFAAFRDAVAGEVDAALDRELHRIYPGLRFADLKPITAREGAIAYAHPETGALVATLAAQAGDRIETQHYKDKYGYNCKRDVIRQYQETWSLYAPRGHVDTSIKVEHAKPHASFTDNIRIVTGITEYYPPQKDKDLMREHKRRAEAERDGARPSTAFYKKAKRNIPGAIRRSRLFASPSMDADNLKTVRREDYALGNRLVSETINHQGGDVTTKTYYAGRLTSAKRTQGGFVLEQYSYDADGTVSFKKGAGDGRSRTARRDSNPARVLRDRLEQTEMQEIRKTWVGATLNGDGEPDHEQERAALRARTKAYSPDLLPEAARRYFKLMSAPLPARPLRGMKALHEALGNITYASDDVMSTRAPGPAIPERVVRYLEWGIDKNLLDVSLRAQIDAYQAWAGVDHDRDIKPLVAAVAASLRSLLNEQDPDQDLRRSAREFINEICKKSRHQKLKNPDYPSIPADVQSWVEAQASAGNVSENAAVSFVAYQAWAVMNDRLAIQQCARDIRGAVTRAAGIRMYDGCDTSLFTPPAEVTGFFRALTRYDVPDYVRDYARTTGQYDTPAAPPADVRDYLVTGVDRYAPETAPVLTYAPG